MKRPNRNVLRSMSFGLIAMLVPAHVGAVTSPVRAATPGIALTCQAFVSNQDPKPQTKVLVYVHTLPRVEVRADARFRGLTVARHGTADRFGSITLSYNSGRTNKGFKVGVTVHVIRGAVQAVCKTSFTPK